jgi:hypothetical protein
MSQKMKDLSKHFCNTYSLKVGKVLSNDKTYAGNFMKDCQGTFTNPLGKWIGLP